MTELPSWRVKRRQTIVAAAARRFARVPFDHVQMDEIAREAEVGKPTLYRYFPSKEDLYLAVCEEAFGKLERRLALAAEGCPPAEALKRIIASLVAFLDEQMSTLDIFSTDASPLRDRWRALFRRHWQGIKAPLRAVLEDGLAQSEFHNLDIDIAPGLIISTIRGGLIINGDIPRKRLVEQMTSFILTGLSGGPAERSGRSVKALTHARGFRVS